MVEMSQPTSPIHRQRLSATDTVHVSSSFERRGFKCIGRARRGMLTMRFCTWNECSTSLLMASLLQNLSAIRTRQMYISWNKSNGDPVRAELTSVSRKLARAYRQETKRLVHSSETLA